MKIMLKAHEDDIKFKSLLYINSHDNTDSDF